MNNRIWKWLALAILMIMIVLTTAMGNASAERQKKLNPFFSVDLNRVDVPKRGTYTHIEGVSSGVTCQEYTFQVINEDSEDSRVQSYNHIVGVLDDANRPNTADTLFSLDTEESSFNYTFYVPGTYVIFTTRFDSDGETVMNGGHENVQKIITITEGTGSNPLTAAVRNAASVCKKSNEFDTAVAINDYLADLFTYDYSFTYYSPEAGLIFDGHTCVCNGYSRAYKLIADQCGLQCKRVIGKVGKNGHAWDAVEINGEWYHVDSTWNDAGESFKHMYLGLSDTVIGIDHSSFSYPDDGNSVICDTLADNYFVHTGKWTDLAGNVVEELQTALNATSGNTVTITANLNQTWLEGGDTIVFDEDIIQISGHIIAWALNKEVWTRTNGGATTPMTGEFAYSYTSGNSKLTGEMTALSYSGTCGENLTWELNDGVLTISGTGDMYDYTIAEPAPWHDYMQDITQVIIHTGVTSIGSNAFYYCLNMTGITIPNGITSIGNYAFYNCYMLTGVSVPTSVANIGIRAFMNCAKISSISIPSGVTAIYPGTFYNCASLASIIIPDSINTIDQGAFDVCYKLTSVYYSGLKNDWEQITKAEDNDFLAAAKLYTHYGTDHVWENPTYSWMEDYSEATATRVCSIDPTYCKETETVSSTSEVTKEATCTTDGETTYTATFTNEAFGTKTETAADIPATGHDEVLEHIERTEATCTTAGNIEYWRCASCGAYFSDEDGLTGITPEETTIAINPDAHTLEYRPAVAATCTKDGTEAYWECTICHDMFSDEEGTAKINAPVVIFATGHSYTAAYNWSEDGKTCNIILTCGKCDDTQTPEVTITSEMKTAAACTEKGTTTYTATAVYNGGTYTDSKDIDDIPALDHDWGYTYDWINNNAQVTATRTCTHDPSHTETETVVTNTEVTKAPTCEEKGETTYTAIFSNGAFTTQSKTVEDIPASGHDWRPASYVYGDSGLGYYDIVLASRSCMRDASHVETETPVKTEEVVVAPTCLNKGISNFTYSFSNPAFETQHIDNVNVNALGHNPIEDTGKIAATCEETGLTASSHCGRCGLVLNTQEVIAALGHDWGNPEYEWSADFSECSARRICKNDVAHTDVENGVITIQATPATSETDGKTVYTAVFTKPYFDTQVYEQVIPRINTQPPAGNHSDASANYTVNADGTATYKGPKKDVATVTIPATIKVGNFNVPVTKIADKAFKGKKKLKTVTIGSNIKQIGTSAFEGCKKLKTVKGGDNVEKIADKAYKGCVALTKYTIGAKVNYIGKNAFNGCTKLKTITVKSTLLTSSNVKSGAFKKINAKATFKVPKAKKKEYAKFLPKKGTKTVKVK